MIQMSKFKKNDGMARKARIMAINLLRMAANFRRMSAVY